MQYLFTTDNISKPTVDTFNEYAKRRFNGLTKFVDANGNAKVNATLRKLGSKHKQYQLKVEVVDNGQQYFAHTTRESITEAVDKVNKSLKRQIKR